MPLGGHITGPYGRSGWFQWMWTRISGFLSPVDILAEYAMLLMFCQDFGALPEQGSCMLLR